MRYFVFYFIIFVLSSCGIDSRFHPSEKVRIASEIRSEAAKKLENEMGLIPLGFGGQMMDQIKMLSLVFQYRHSIDVEEGRSILIQAANKFITEINSNEKVRQYLSHYPFEPKNIEIMVVLQKPDGSNVDKGELAIIALRDGVLQFKFDDANHSFFRTYEETYEEAFEKWSSRATEP
jgi:hypothetical protein